MTSEILGKKVNEMLDKLGTKAAVNIESDGESYLVNIDGVSLNYLIGYKGESLEAFSHILAHSFFKDTGEWPRIRLDINGYKATKLEKLEEMVKSIIDRVRFHRKELKLPYLNSFERRHVHTFVGEYMDVKSESRGEGKERRLFIVPKED